MKAVVLHSDLSLALTEINTPKIHQDELLVKIKVVGLCGSDRRVLSTGSPRLEFPAVIGHEFSGVIVEVGEGVNGWKSGERVVLNSSIPCGCCHACMHNRENLCKSQIVFGYQIHGGMAEYVKIPARAIKQGVIQRIPKGLDFDLAALAEPVAAMVNAFELLMPKRHSSLAIIGGSSTAVSAAMLAMHYGCSEVTIFVSVRKFGQMSEIPIPNVTVICMAEDYTIDLTRNYDAVVVCADSLKAQDIGLKLLAPRGRIHFFGVVPKSEGQLLLNSNDIHYLEQSITGSFGSCPTHLATALQLIDRNRQIFRSVISETYHFYDYESAFLNLEEGDCLKVQLTFEVGS